MKIVQKLTTIFKVSNIKTSFSHLPISPNFSAMSSHTFHLFFLLPLQSASIMLHKIGNSFTNTIRASVHVGVGTG